MKDIFNGVIALVVLIAGVVGIAVGARWGLTWLFDGVNPTVSAAIVAAAATTLVSVLGVTLGRFLERRHQIDLELREQKVPIYTEFVEGLLSVFASANESDDDQKPTSSGPQRNKTAKGKVDTSKAEAKQELDMLEFLTGMTPKLMIWASNDVVVKWSKFRRGADRHPPLDYMFMMEDLLTAIRKDLGHSGGGITKGDLLGLYINDIDDHLPASKGSQADEAVSAPTPIRTGPGALDA
jgi:hypothetical protein